MSPSGLPVHRLISAASSTSDPRRRRTGARVVHICVESASNLRLDFQDRRVHGTQRDGEGSKISGHGNGRSKTEGRARRRRRDLVAHLFSRRRSRRAGVLRPRHPRAGATRHVRGDLFPPLARAPAQSSGTRRLAIAAGGRAAVAGADPAADEDAAAVRRHGCAADPDVGAWPLRSRCAGQLGGRVVPQGGAADRADRQPGGDVGPHAGRAADRSRRIR